MNIARIVLAALALALLGACTSTDEHGVVVSKSFLVCAPAASPEAGA